jgi:hypothetical protein
VRSSANPQIITVAKRALLASERCGVAAEKCDGTPAERNVIEKTHTLSANYLCEGYLELIGRGSNRLSSLRRFQLAFAGAQRTIKVEWLATGFPFITGRKDLKNLPHVS